MGHDVLGHFPQSFFVKRVKRHSSPGSELPGIFQPLVDPFGTQSTACVDERRTGNSTPRLTSQVVTLVAGDATVVSFKQNFHPHALAFG